jgi:uncharacterized membrane protein
MKRNQTNQLTILAMFFAIIAVLAYLNQMVFTIWPFPIRPTILQVPVIIASLLLGPKMGAIVGGWWGIISVIQNTIITSPIAFVFSPFQPVTGTNHGDIKALIVAIVPRILVGVLPYFIYKIFAKNTKLKPLGLVLSGGIGSVINTVFVLGAIYLFFSSVLGWTLSGVLSMIIATNSLAEMIISAVLTAAIAPTLLRVYQKNHQK